MVSWNKRLLALALAVLAFDALWTFRLAPHQLHTSYFTGDLVYETDGNALETVPGTLVYNRYIETHKMTRSPAENGMETMEFRSIVHKLPKNELFWEQANSTTYDPETLRIAGSDAYLVFPPHANKRDYRVKFFSYIPDSGIDFHFSGTDEIRGLAVYRYDFRVDDLDWTENYNLNLPAEIRVKSRDWGAVWIEPVSGVLVDHKEHWVASAEGQGHDGFQVDVGSMWFANDTITKQAFLAQNVKRASILYEVVLPLALLAIAGIVAATAATRRHPPIRH